MRRRTKEKDMEGRVWLRKWWRWIAVIVAYGSIVVMLLWYALSSSIV